MGRLWTVNDSWNTVISLAIGILFGLVQPSIERIVAHLLAYICYKLPSSYRAEQDEDEDPDESTPLRSSSQRSRIERGSLSKSRHRRCTRANAAKVVSLVTVVAFIIAGTFVTRFSIEGTALSASKRCGAWGLKDDANNAALDEDALVQGEKETRAGQYARDCYSAHSSSRLNRCSVFKEALIPTSQLSMNQQCPFVDQTYCPGDSYTAVKFSTGIVDATHIGVNRNRAPKFNRTTICTPFDLNAGFVQHLDRRGEYGYELGPVTGDKYQSQYTFHQLGDPWYYDVRAYTMR